MKNLVRSIIILLFPLTAFSQKEYFIYLQSEAEQPFFVRLEDKSFNSSPAGYLILSKLKDTTHTLIVGFPGNKWPEQRFSVAIGARDHGFLLKNFGEKGWGLFNLQTMDVKMAAGNAASKKKNGGNSATVSLFTEILSKAANDPSLKEEPEFAVAMQKTEPVKAVNITQAEPKATVEQPKLPDTSAKKEMLVAKQVAMETGDQPASKTQDSPMQNKNDSLGKSKENNVNEKSVAVVEEKPKEEIAAKDDVITKENTDKKENNQSLDSAKTVVLNNAGNASQSRPVVSESTGDAGKKEEVQTKNETIAVDPGRAAPSKDYERSEVIRKSERSTTDGFGLTFIDKIADFRQDTIEIFIPNPKSILVENRKAPADDKKFLDIRESDGNKSVQQSAGKAECTSVASENDFFRLRKKMAGEKESESMINEAKKEFKTKCFTVDQIRNLGNLFFNEAGKFQFYEVAYSSSTDKDGFVVLQSELKDPYFVHRFKNLVN